MKKIVRTRRWVSSSVLDRLHVIGINARYIEVGIEGLNDAGGMVDRK